MAPTTSDTLPLSAPTQPLVPDLTIDNITEKVVQASSQSGDARLNYLMERLVTHVHDFARETRLSTSEWMAAIQFLTQTGQMCSPVRQEFILLSDVLGLSMLIDSIDHPKPPNCTQGSVLGPFHTSDAPHLPIGSSMTTDTAGEPLLALCTVCDSSGRPLSGVKVDIWEADSSGHYDVQYASRQAPSERCVMTSDVDGGFWFRAIRPVGYPVPDDGPVGRLLGLLKRHSCRPAHMHFMFEKQGLDPLITTLFIRGDEYETSDVVFGVKTSLVVDLDRVDEDTAAKYGVPQGTLLLRHKFVLASAQETEELRDRNAMEAMRRMGLKTKLVDHLPVPDLD
ncbi:aromatic compound dioxygenase [Trichoderma citrinoviride]|uniref:Aromatic compound dioxygenase n=1 Tax=Trichoderma citrinoviride TaxID=58853 RepID=A0A2T4BMH9_9HYPO|nr:aromatic compound dioxygenase [Trichoderma citrinoviride]PTB70480.1 aromatic compound dioxygenase [Trichoderma citrinoviride]